MQQLSKGIASSDSTSECEEIDRISDKKTRHELVFFCICEYVAGISDPNSLNDAKFQTWRMLLSVKRDPAIAMFAASRWAPYDTEKSGELLRVATSYGGEQPQVLISYMVHLISIGKHLEAVRAGARLLNGYFLSGDETVLALTMLGRSMEEIGHSPLATKARECLETPYDIGCRQGLVQQVERVGE